LNGVGLGPGKDAIDLARRNSDGTREPLDADAIHQRRKVLEAFVLGEIGIHPSRHVAVGTSSVQLAAAPVWDDRPSAREDGSKCRPRISDTRIPWSGSN